MKSIVFNVLLLSFLLIVSSCKKSEKIMMQKKEPTKVTYTGDFGNVTYVFSEPDSLNNVTTTFKFDDPMVGAIIGRVKTKRFDFYENYITFDLNLENCDQPSHDSKNFILSNDDKLFIIDHSITVTINDIYVFKKD